MTQVRCGRCNTKIEERIVTEENPLKLRAQARKLAFHLNDGQRVCRACLRTIAEERYPELFAAREKPRPAEPPIPDLLPPDGWVWRRCEAIRPSAQSRWQQDASYALQRRMEPPAPLEPCRMPMLVKRDQYDVRCPNTPYCPGMVNPRPDKVDNVLAMRAPTVRRR